jgi:hypothetical protein
MKLMTKELEKKIPGLYQQDGLGRDAKVFCKLFHPMSNYTWYITEYDPVTKECFGVVQGHFTEFGYFSLAELENITIRGLKVERDKYFEPTTIKELGIL